MPKPLGMDPFFRVIQPTSVQDAVWEAVEQAIDAGMTVEQFRREAADCWAEKLRQKAKDDTHAWESR